MRGLAESLSRAMAEDLPLLPTGGGSMDPYGFVVKVVRLTNDRYPGRDAHGVLPVFVTGHESMDRGAWNGWVREHGLAHYGAGYTERVIRDGIELKEMMPTAGFGRHMRLSKGRYEGQALNAIGDLVTAVEKWPQLYNLIATDMAEQEMTLREFLDRVQNLPAPWELGAGAYTTLGDLLKPPGAMVLPGER